MPGYIAMLRGVNVSGQRMMRMEELRKVCTDIGLEDPRTYVQSGNVVFDSMRADPPELRRKIETRLKQAFDFDVLVFVRTRDELRRLVDGSPFAGRDASKMHVTFLYEKPEAFPTPEMNKAKRGEEEFLVQGKEVYLFCPGGYGRTKLSNGFFEKKLGVSATTRNWRTVNALLDMAK